MHNESFMLPLRQKIRFSGCFRRSQRKKQKLFCFGQESSTLFQFGEIIEV